MEGTLDLFVLLLSFWLVPAGVAALRAAGLLCQQLLPSALWESP
jgi:hypothetical protein